MVSGGSFAIAQYLSSTLSGRNCRRISSLVSLVCLTLFLKRWQPVRIFRFGDMGASRVDQTLARYPLATGQIVRWSPFLFLTATVALWSIPPGSKRCLPPAALYDWRVINVPVPVSR